MSQAFLERLASRIRNLVGIGHLKLVDDSGVQQVAQVTLAAGGPNVEVIDAMMRLAHYGMAYCPPDGSEAVIVFLGGHRSNGVIVATGDRDTRFKDLLPGEFMVGNQVTDKWMRFAQDGKIRVNGDMEVTGHIYATGDIVDNAPANGVTVKQSRDAYNAHKHTGVQAGGASTAVTDHPVP